MRALSTSELLIAWERGLGQRPDVRALHVLAAACPDEPPEALARLSIGARDRRLLLFRESTFGQDVVGMTRCRSCGEDVELSFRTRAVLVDQAAADRHEFNFDAAGFQFRARLPDSSDLAAAAGRLATSRPAGAVDAGLARRVLLERCVLDASRDGQPVGAGELPEAAVTALAAALAERDPQADVRLAVRCPACAAQWDERFDIVAFLCAEIDAWAPSVLRDVHELARAYGWREADILAMSPWRRQFYLRAAAG